MNDVTLPNFLQIAVREAYMGTVLMMTEPDSDAAMALASATLDTIDNFMSRENDIMLGRGPMAFSGGFESTGAEVSSTITACVFF